MTSFLRVCSAALLAASLGACGDIIDEVLPPPGSCNLPATASCTDYTGQAWTTPSSGQQACSRVGAGAVYSTSACPTANRIGSCRVNPGTASEVTTRFYSTRYDANTARASCSALGTGAVYVPG